MITQLLQLSVNGERVQRVCEPRTHLGDFLRKDLGLTGTHLSCEHGICGACTVLIDGTPQRACITFAVACEDAEITTIEGYGDDPVMAALRRAFHEHHALQCGYCTPGMLCTARDIVLRLPGPDAVRVRHELAGNLCRCTGYVGIVEAIDSVLQAKARGELVMPATAPRAAPSAGHGVGQQAAMPMGAIASALSAQAMQAIPTAHAAQDTQVAKTAVLAGAPAPTPPAASTASASASTASASASATAIATAFADWTPVPIPAEGEGTEVSQMLNLPLPAQALWQRLQDLPLVARCLPGASVSEHAGDRATGQIDIRFGPISAAFAMRAELFLEPEVRIGRMHAEGTDRFSGTRVRSRLHYRVHAEGEAASRLEMRLQFQLIGPLAQFSRSGLVTDYVTELSRRFGLNLQQAAVAAGGGGGETSAGQAGDAASSALAPAAPLAAPSLFGLFWARVRRWLGLG